MRNHDQKRRDMARSILPSKNREAARTAVAKAKRAGRHAVRQDLRAIVASVDGAPDDPFVDWDERRPLDSYPDAEIGWTVQRRRQGDKLNHFIRWAVATTADLPVEERLSHLRTQLPAGLIGDHALSHLDDEPDLRPPMVQEWRYHRLRGLTSEADRAAAQAEATAELSRLLRDVIAEPQGLRDLNHTMKECDHHASHQGCVDAGCIKRCLGGLHDVGDFLQDAWIAPKPARADREPALLPVRQFLEFLEQHHPEARPAALVLRWHR